MPRPTGLPAMHQPVSVCHQWSMTGTFNCVSAHSTVGGSARSPAKNSVRNFERSYCRMNFPSGSSFLMARNAVGAVKRATALCSEITRQNAPASGVPTGLPSYMIEVAPGDAIAGVLRPLQNDAGLGFYARQPDRLVEQRLVVHDAAGLEPAACRKDQLWLGVLDAGCEFFRGKTAEHH